MGIRKYFIHLKFDGRAVSAVIGVILIVVITVAIAATAYVYVGSYMTTKPAKPIVTMLMIHYQDGKLVVEHISGDPIEDALFTYSTTGLVGYWKMDEDSWDGTPDEVIDSSGMGNHGTAKNGADTIADGKYGRAGSFDGTDDYVEVPDSQSLEIGGNKISFGAWVRVSSLGKFQEIIHKDKDWWIQVTDTNHIKCAINPAHSNSITLSSNYILSNGDIGKWLFVFCVYDGSKVNLYINGKLDNYVTYTETIAQDTTSLTIGLNSPAGSYYFNGLIDEVRIYNRALSAEEIDANYHAGWRNLEVRLNGEPIDIRNVSSSGKEFTAGSILTITQNMESGDEISIIYRPANQLIRKYTVP